jgi:hypothetical protein
MDERGAQGHIPRTAEWIDRHDLRKGSISRQGNREACLKDGSLEVAQIFRTHNSVHEGLTLGLSGKERSSGGEKERETHHNVKVEG